MSVKACLDADIQRIASSIAVIVTSDSGEVQRIIVPSAARIHETVAQAFGLKESEQLVVYFGSEQLPEDLSFDDCGIEVCHSSVGSSLDPSALIDKVDCAPPPHRELAFAGRGQNGLQPQPGSENIHQRRLSRVPSQQTRLGAQRHNPYLVRRDESLIVVRHAG